MDKPVEKGDGFRKGIGAKLEAWGRIHLRLLVFQVAETVKDAFLQMTNGSVSVWRIPVIGRKGVLGRSFWVRKGVEPSFFCPHIHFDWASTSGGLEQDETTGPYFVTDLKVD